MDYSVITICLNSAQTIGRTIDSVLSQTRRPRQYLFVDGGSTDGTLEIVEACARRCADDSLRIETVTIHQRTGGGIAGAWNMGLAKSTADVVFILNSDDWYDADCAERVMAHFEVDSSVDMVVGSTRLFSKQQERQARIYKTKSFCLFPFLNPINHPACFVRRRVYERVGTYSADYKVAADYDFLYRCFKAKVGILKDEGVIVNREGGGYAERNRSVSRVELNRIARKYCSVPLLPDLALFVRRAARR